MLKQAVILVGGKGTRLGPLTQSRPKPLLEVDGRPFLEHLIQEISRYGFERVTLLAGNLGSQFVEAYDGRILEGLRIDVVLEEHPLGTGGALRHAAESDCLENEFLLMNGDSWIDTNLVRLSLYWETMRQSCPDVEMLMLLKGMDDVSRYGSVGLDGGLVSYFKEKNPEMNRHPGLINAGVYVLNRNVVCRVDRGTQVSLERDILPSLVDQRRVAGMIADIDSYFIDIGLPETLEQSRNELALRRRRPAIFLDRDGTLNRDSGYTHKPQDLVWIEGAKEAIKLANDSGFFVFVVTNQSGVARGLYDEEAIVRFHGAMQKDLFKVGAHIDAFHWCPHHPEGQIERYKKHCSCRKPQPGMITELANRWPLDLHGSVMVGDSVTDLKAADAAGISSIKYSGGNLADLIRHYISSD